MNKKDLRAGVALVRKTAVFLQQWADELEGSPAKDGRKAAADEVPAAVEDVADETVVESAAEDSVAETVAEESAASPELTLEYMREYLGTKSAAGYKTQVNALVCSYGVSKLSEIDPYHYPELLEAVKGLGDSDA